MSEYDLNKIKEEINRIFNSDTEIPKVPKWNTNKIKRASDWIGNDHTLQKIIAKQLGIKK